MSGRITLQDLTDTGRTLLIPLSGRAYGAELFPELGFRDERAREWADRIEYDRGLFVGDRQAVWGTILRTQAFDAVVREFIERNPGGTVLNLGAGLCTRYFRLSPARATWLELDVPEVIELKRRFCEPTESYRLVPFDLGSRDSWDSLAPFLGRPVLVVAEGVFMFLQPEAVDRVFATLLALPIPSLGFTFDYLHPWVMRHRWMQPRSFRATGASYSWSARSLRGLLAAHPSLRAVTDQALSARFPLSLRLLNRGVRALAGSSLYDIAVAERA